MTSLAARTPTSPRRSLTWGTPSMWIERVPCLLASKLGLYDRMGLDVTVRVYDGGPELLEAFRTGEVHCGEIGLPPLVAAVSKYEPTNPSTTAPEVTPGRPRVVGSTFIQQLDHYIAVGTEEATDKSGGQKDQDDGGSLEGAAVGVLSKGSCDSYLLEHILKAEGIDSKGVKVVPLGPEYGSPAPLLERRVDASFFVEPALTSLEDAGRARLLLRAGDYFPVFQWNTLIASEQILSSDPGLVKQLLEVYTQACTIMAWLVDGADFDAADSSWDITSTTAWASFDGVAEESFGVSRQSLLKSLSRNREGWCLDPVLFNVEGALNCIQMQSDLGALKHPTRVCDVTDLGFLPHCCGV